MQTELRIYGLHLINFLDFLSDVAGEYLLEQDYKTTSDGSASFALNPKSSLIEFLKDFAILAEREKKHLIIKSINEYDTGVYTIDLVYDVP